MISGIHELHEFLIPHLFPAIVKLTQRDKTCSSRLSQSRIYVQDSLVGDPMAARLQQWLDTFERQDAEIQHIPIAAGSQREKWEDTGIDSFGRKRVEHLTPFVHIQDTHSNNRAASNHDNEIDQSVFHVVRLECKRVSSG
jgi:hypothetical protein